jgi:cell division protease FtsH
MRNDPLLERAQQRYQLVIDDRTRMPFRIVADGAAEKQLELFKSARLGPEPAPADDSQADDDAEQDEKTARGDHDARKAIVTAAFLAATTPAIRRRITGLKPVCIVVAVPAAAWVKAVENYFDDDMSRSWVTFARDGSNRAHHKSTVGNDEAAGKLSAGRRLVGIATNPELILPATLVAAADITIKIAINGAVVRGALRCLRGRLPDHVDDELVAKLDFEDLVAAMRAGSTKKQAVERMRTVFERRADAQRVERYPRLEDAVEYGAAQKWGLDLARDLDDYRSGQLTWDKIDRGAVFYSEPGCGKSVLAGSIAHACKIPLIRASVADFFKGEGALGDVIKAQRAVFAQASALARPVLVLLDECDAIPNRQNLSNRGADWWLPIITDLLLLLDSGLSSRERIIVIGATNRIHALEPALLRPGRLERAIEIRRPDLPGTINILRFHLGVDLQGTDITAVARLAEGSTAAELMEHVRGARRRARYAQRALSLDDLMMQIQGEQNVPPALLRRIAIHEAGHAVTTVALSIGELRHVTLQSRATSGGHTKVRNIDDDLMTLCEIENRVVSILSAGVAEKLLLGSKSVGSGGLDTSDDGIASAMLSVIYASTSITGEFFHRCSTDDALATVRGYPQLRRKVEQHLRQLEKRATDLVEHHLKSIDAVARALAEKRHLTGDEVVAIMQAVSCNKQPAKTLELITTERS